MEARKLTEEPSDEFAYDVLSSYHDPVLFIGNQNYFFADLADGKDTHVVLDWIDNKKWGTFAGPYYLTPVNIETDHHLAISLEFKVPIHLRDAVKNRISEYTSDNGKVLYVNHDDDIARIFLKDNFNGLWFKADKDSSEQVFISAEELRAKHQKPLSSFNKILNTFGKFGTRPTLNDLDRLSDELICPIKCGLL